MSSLSTTPTSDDAHGHAAGHGNGHNPHLAHHFDTPEQQIASGKLGMWVFLATEILMFGGLFCAYSVYRHNHPEVFEVAHKELNKRLGAINTVVLITSSLTMAWGVRLAQLGKNRGLIITLILTILGGYGFMAIKSVEYKTKWEHQLGLGKKNMFAPTGTAGANQGGLVPPGAGIPSAGEHKGGHAGGDAHAAPVAAGDGGAAPPAVKPHDDTSARNAPADGHKTADTGTHGATEAGHPNAVVVTKPALSPYYVDPNAGGPDAARVVPVVVGPPGMAPKAVENADAEHDPNQISVEYKELPSLDKARTYTFFQIYFLMTGLHGLHVVIGMALIFWILVRAVPAASRRTVLWAGAASVGLFLLYVGLLVNNHPTFWVGIIFTALAAVGWFIGALKPAPRLAGAAGGEFGPEYFAPVDIVGLYWHLVDLIWIFLFPLLYLIH